MRTAAGPAEPQSGSGGAAASNLSTTPTSVSGPSSVPASASATAPVPSDPRAASGSASTSTSASSSARRRYGPACDACRLRKIKCDASYSQDNSLFREGLRKCASCLYTGIPCTFQHKTRRRGPVPQYMTRLNLTNGITANESGPNTGPIRSGSLDSARHGSFTGDRESSVSLAWPPALQPEFDRSDTHMQMDALERHERTYSHSSHSGLAGKGPGDVPEVTIDSDPELEFDPAHYLRSTPHTPHQPGAGPGGHHVQPAESYAQAHMTADHHMGSTSSGTSTSYPHNMYPPERPRRMPTLPEPRFIDLPALTSTNNAVPPPHNPLADILPRDIMLEILDVYFDYIYPLLALPHRPSFFAGVAERREEILPPGSPEVEEWVALVLSIVAFALVQMPHDIIPTMNKEKMRALVHRCCDVVRPWIAREHHRPTLDRLTITWCYGTVLNNRGFHVQARALHASNVVNALQLGLNDPITYVGMNLIEGQIGRRLFWNLYMADRSSTVSENGHLLINEDDCKNMDLPLEVDDEFITAFAILPQPDDHPSIVRGFVDGIRLFRLAGLLLHGRQRDRWERPTGLLLKGRIAELDELCIRFEDFMLPLRPELQLEVRPAEPSPGNPLASWDTISPRSIGPLISHTRLPNSRFLVLQCNHYVTQQMFRLMSITYRDELRALAHQEAVASNSSLAPSTAVPLPDSTAATDQVLTDLSRIIHSIPTEIHVFNSWPSITKIRFVASSLLSKLESDAILLFGEGAGDEVDEEQQKAKGLLVEYLRFLTTIEQLYSLKDDDRV